MGNTPLYEEQIKTKPLEDISKGIYEWKKLKYYDDKRREEGIPKVDIETPFRLGSIFKIGRKVKGIDILDFRPRHPINGPCN